MLSSRQTYRFIYLNSRWLSRWCARRCIFSIRLIAMMTRRKMIKYLDISFSLDYYHKRVRKVRMHDGEEIAWSRLSSSSWRPSLLLPVWCLLLLRPTLLTRGLISISTVTRSTPAALPTRFSEVVLWWTGSVAWVGTVCSDTMSTCLGATCRTRALDSTVVVTRTTSATATPTLGVAGSQSRSSRSCFSVYERCERDKSLLWVIIR